jgi:hypothetical protein
MLKHRTTIVLGAGASKELGLPLGVELQAQIHHLLKLELNALKSGSVSDLRSPAYPVGAAMLEMNYDAATLLRTYQHLIVGILESPSIDTFLNHNCDDNALVTMGKLAILNCILRGEQECFAYDPAKAEEHFFPYNAQRQRQKNPNYLDIPWPTFAVQNSYLNVLWNELSQSHRNDDLDELFRNLSIVNFNYDRSVEYVFSQKIAAAFPLAPAQKRSDVLDSLHCIRPYGSPSGDQLYSSARLPFACRNASLHEHIGSIRTFTEALDEKVGLDIKDAISNSRVVVILGFGFHPQNLDLLTVDRRGMQQVFFSHFGGARENVDSIRRDLAERMTRHEKNRLPNLEQVFGIIGSSLETLTSHHHAIFRSAS